MAHIREDIKKVQYAPGQDTIDVEMDARYSNQTHSDISNTPNQAATQMTQLVPEKLTKDKKIIARYIQSKLCQVCVHWQGQKIECYQHHTDVQLVSMQPTQLGMRDSGRVKRLLTWLMMASLSTSLVNIESYKEDVISTIKSTTVLQWRSHSVQKALFCV